MMLLVASWGSPAGSKRSTRSRSSVKRAPASRRAIDVELLGALPEALVAVGRGEHDDGAGARLDRRPADLDVRGGDASEEADR
jgi:hypothetical protein